MTQALLLCSYLFTDKRSQGWRDHAPGDKHATLVSTDVNIQGRRYDKSATRCRRRYLKVFVVKTLQTL